MSYAEPRRESMREHAQEFASRVSHDVDVSDIDSKIDDAVASKFGHNPGSLKRSELFDSDVPIELISLAREISNPQMMRDAIILREILQRPEDRWRFDEPMYGAIVD